MHPRGGGGTRVPTPCHVGLAGLSARHVVLSLPAVRTEIHSCLVAPPGTATMAGRSWQRDARVPRPASHQRLLL